MRTVHLIALLVALPSCSPKSRDAAASSSSASSAAAAPASASAAPSASAAASDDDRHMRFSTAGYVKDLLTTCLDMDVVYKDAATATSKKKALVEKNSAKGSNLTVLPDACDKTFSDRKPLATCTEDMKPGAVIESGKTIHRFYLFEFLRGDGSMRDCIKEGGKWESVSHDSPEYEKAQTEAELRKNDEEMKRLEAQLPH